MKKTFMILIMSGLFSVIGCREEKANILAIEPDRINFPEEGGRAEITIQTDAPTWQIDNPASDWLTLSATSGTGDENDITLNVSTKTTSPRLDSLTISAGDAVPVTVIVSQQASDHLNELVVRPDRLEFSEEGGTEGITILTDADSWQIENPVSDWLVLSATSGTGDEKEITLNVSTKTTSQRLDSLAVTAGDADPVYVIVSQQTTDHLYELTIDKSSVNFDRNGGSETINVSTDAPVWQISSDSDWLQFSQASGTSGSTDVEITVPFNPENVVRTASVVISAEYTDSVDVTVIQEAAIYPDYNTDPLPPDATGMSSNASELAAKIILGWNLGNSLEAIGGETAWGNPRVTKALIDLVRQSGFNAVRIPCSWNQYMASTTTAQLKTDWLNRVRDVIQYCIDNDMYVLLNIHWDGGWLENNCTTSSQEANNAKQKAFWEQIATHLRDFDEHLLFASANEPNVDNATQMAVLKSYHQTFIDAVRSTGGRNSYRVLVIQGPSTDIDKTVNLMTSMPTDEIPDRLMVEVHYYTPWNFCGLTKDESWGKMFYYWGNGYHSTTDTERNATWGEEETVDAKMKLMKTRFVDKGYPVILGEYGAIRRSTLTGDNLTNHLTSRAYYLEYVTGQARANGIMPFYWDNGGTGNYGFGIFNRNNNTIFDQQALDALLEGAAK